MPCTTTQAIVMGKEADYIQEKNKIGGFGGLVETTSINEEEWINRLR